MLPAELQNALYTASVPSDSLANSSGRSQAECRAALAGAAAGKLSRRSSMMVAGLLGAAWLSKPRQNTWQCQATANIPEAAGESASYHVEFCRDGWCLPELQCESIQMA